jgi:uncharacterized damage-inducible protein DinB
VIGRISQEGAAMDPTIAGLHTLIVRELNAFIREVEMFPDDARLWQTVPGITNSAGNLALHVTGNLQHFIGHVLGGTGYVRNRDDEFARRSGTRAWLATELNRTIDVVSKVLPQVTGETLAREYPERVADQSINCRVFLLHLGVHLAYHLGQAGYLRRALTGENQSSGPLPLKPLAVPTRD